MLSKVSLYTTLFDLLYSKCFYQCQITIKKTIERYELVITKINGRGSDHWSCPLEVLVGVSHRRYLSLKLGVYGCICWSSSCEVIIEDDHRRWLLELVVIASCWKWSSPKLGVKDGYWSWPQETLVIEGGNERWLLELGCWKWSSKQVPRGSRSRRNWVSEVDRRSWISK